MCGIAGIYNGKIALSDAERLVKKMVDAQHHRGPDDWGMSALSEVPSVVVGQSRLSIIDLSADGHQPMVDPQTGNVIVFNGEIYNFHELKKMLEGKGYCFHSRSDTEVILYAYSEWGKNCLKKFRGIFAFAIWDKKEESLFLARDPMGVKPLYYYQKDDRQIFFASEVRALLAAGVPRNIGKEGLMSFMCYGSVQEPFTLVDKVYSLPPAHYMSIGKENMDIVRYWCPDTGCLPAAWLSQNDADEYVDELLRESVRGQMMSDVPLGAFLSGGIDSSAIVSLMRQSMPGADIHTFAVVFDQSDYDERKYSRMVAERNCTQHTELELNGSMVRRYLKEALASFDQPSMDGLNTWFVSGLVKEAGITVALSGVGGDEFFVGYDGFAKPLLLEKWRKRLSVIPTIVGQWLQSPAFNENLRKLSQLISEPCPSYFISRRVFTDLQIGRLLNEDYNCRDKNWFNTSYGELEKFSFVDEISRISCFESRSYMLSTLLRDTDQMSMAHSLEVRVPLVDHRIAEFLWQLPKDLKVVPGIPKALLVHAGGQGLPPECVYRKKQGFVFPFDSYFREEMGEELQAFYSSLSHPLFKRDGLYGLWSDYKKGRVSWSRVWMLFVLHNWLIENKIQYI